MPYGIKLRQPRVYQLWGYGDLHKRMSSYMSARGYNDSNRAYILNVGEENVVPVSKDFYRVTFPYPDAKDFRAVMVIPSNQVMKSDCVANVSERQTYDIDLGERSKSRKVTYTDENGNRAESYVTASFIERYMNFSDFAYKAGYESLMDNSAHARDIAAYISKAYEQAGYNPFPVKAALGKPILASGRGLERKGEFEKESKEISDFFKTYDLAEGWDKTRLLSEFSDAKPKIIDFCIENKDAAFMKAFGVSSKQGSTNGKTFEIYSRAFLKGAVDRVHKSIHTTYDNSFVPVIFDVGSTLTSREVSDFRFLCMDTKNFFDVRRPGKHFNSLRKSLGLENYKAPENGNAPNVAPPVLCRDYYDDYLPF